MECLIFNLSQVMLLLNKLDKVMLLHKNIKTLLIYLIMQCLLMNRRKIRANMKKFCHVTQKLHHY